MDYTAIGKIINTHGVNGEVKVYPYTDDAKRFSILKFAYVGDDKLKVHVVSVKYHKGLPLIKFKGYDNINDVLNFKEQIIYVDDANRVILPENHYFIYDLVGCHVYDMKDNYIGKVVEVLKGASNDVYVVKDESHEEHLIPAVKEFVKNVNIDKKTIYIDPIEGMIE
ncbi:ribosome maturation factor RimM [Paratissierella segnis]|jgi:16S rRNA processing protein RimM|uniref:Ribosome maturation factor RimM n=1 Tax=Paratissierella segnis TaxID=2763679 RepID=A0A926IK87_9FIRM|nr:ribosome maturation factor RimM [Paratissierella segnis]MBC8588809.1 ribosome maturation factor RimM [Paratissierella segnis]